MELVLGPDANDDSVADVYVSCFGDDSVRRFDGISGLPIDDGSIRPPWRGWTESSRGIGI